MGSVKRCPPNCPDRSWQPNCHTTCEIYLAQQEENRKEREARREQMESDRFHIGLVLQSCDRVRKKKKRGGQ